MDADTSLVLAFLNTLDVEANTDVLRAQRDWQEWAGERQLAADPLDEAARARDSLRAAVGDPDVEAHPTRAKVEVTLTPDGPAMVPGSAVAAVLAAAARLAVLGEWDRIKICPADDCRWAFYDRSRNRSRTWCSMKVCGNREKARAFRERTATKPTT
ncbi:putative RNA-binding Zn ribbon-like protein [Saccharomonospora amisosensis]|uniref:Putative RNA-binding Zn ribbon-like protein n=1 Tax=Saccharomonospora amisosensis TaxID=1128677 RepID=A0A7X5UUX3_9PSEU|nr:CGNR zinc finger domain-containing protein [Saccharomonospora amisosensis]NIJ14701.1 putative RNA-binding Zn ribbon-like protein [Saccharomonospora amisosensis]